MTYVVLRGTLRALRGTLEPNDAVGRTVALVIAIAAFPELMTKGVYGAIRGLYRLLFSVPASLLDVTPPHPPQPETDSAWGAFVADACQSFVQVGRDRLGELSTWFSSTFPVEAAAQAIVLWLLLSQVFAKVAPAVVQKWPPVGSVLARIRLPSAEKVGLVAILALGSFLSLAVIASLPRLTESNSPNDNLSAKALEESLVNVQTAVADLPAAALQLDVRRSPPASPPGAASSTPPVPALVPPAGNRHDDARPAPLRAPVANSRAPVPPAARATPVDASSTVPRDLLAIEPADRPDADEPSKMTGLGARFGALRGSVPAELGAAWGVAVNDAKSLQERIISGQKLMRSNAVARYQVANVNQHGSKEELKDFLAIRDWYATAVERSDIRLEDHLARLRIQARELVAWAASVRRFDEELATPGAYRLKDLEGELDSLEGRARELRSEFHYLSFNVGSAATSAAGEAPPPAPPLEGSLGPLSLAAGWLLKADSVPLTLVVGMIGFGLLGAAISTAVKSGAAGEAARKGLSAPLAKDLAGIVFRGVSAAVVVFLAVQGGLAIVSSSTPNPNPYVVLLTCFVAAVFSERVWAGASEYLAARLPQRAPDESGAEPPKVPGATTQG